MGTFWKPCGAAAVYHGQHHAPTKILGTGVYVLWARCDLCQWSGSSDNFNLLERGFDSATLCGYCAGDDRVVGSLLSDGWKFRG